MCRVVASATSLVQAGTGCSGGRACSVEEQRSGEEWRGVARSGAEWRWLVADLSLRVKAQWLLVVIWREDESVFPYVIGLRSAF